MLILLLICKIIIITRVEPLTVADLRGGARDARTPPGAQILSISCSFWGNMAKSYVGAPPPGSWRPLLGEILDPPFKTPHFQHIHRIPPEFWRDEEEGIPNEICMTFS